MPVNSLGYSHISRHCCGHHGLPCGRHDAVLWPTWYRLVFSPVSFVLCALILFQTLALYKSFTYLLTYLSVPVQVIAWKASSPKWPIMCQAGRKTLLTFSLTHAVDVHFCSFTCYLLCRKVGMVSSLSPGVPVLSQSLNFIIFFFFCIHCTATVTSSVHVPVGRHPLPTRLPSRTCEAVKNRASHHMSSVC